MTGATRVSQSPRPARARVRGEGSGHSQVAQIQRARILSAMFDVATELGAANVSVADVVERSGVSRRTFYESFSGREDCFLAAFEDALELASQRVLSAYRAEGTWRERIRAGLIALLCFLDGEPVIARLLIVESSSGGARALERRNRVLSVFATAIDEGREEASNISSLPPLTAEGLVGGVLAVIHARIANAHTGRVGSADTEVAGDAEPLVGLANQLVSMIVLPYLGSTAARRELERPVERQASAPVGPCDGHDGRSLGDPFRSMGMRLTYRTVRVLLAVSDHPGGSNRIIGEGAGIADQGQISKLLGRLQRLGLISNTGLAPGQGAPNEWMLTQAGRRLTQIIHTHTGSGHPELAVGRRENA